MGADDGIGQHRRECEAVGLGQEQPELALQYVAIGWIQGSGNGGIAHRGHCRQIRYWHALEDGRVQCDVCPRFCKLHEGQRGLCFVRARHNDAIALTTYGRSSGFCVDPIEKKPLNHFLPGTPVFSFGTAGCNLTCKFCQNYDISKAREIDRLNQDATPVMICGNLDGWRGGWGRGRGEARQVWRLAAYPSGNRPDQDGEGGHVSRAPLCSAIQCRYRCSSYGRAGRERGTLISINAGLGHPNYPGRA
jgi:hypothetical protein